MSDGDLLTVGDLADIFGLEPWRIRRAVDSVECGVRRVGLYRLIPRSQLAVVGAELQRRGWLASAAGPASEGVSDGD